MKFLLSEWPAPVWCSSVACTKEVTWTEASKNEFNRPKGDERGQPGERNSMHKMWTLKGSGADSASGAGEMWDQKGSRGLECWFRELYFILSV